jgi:hypothetical protein
MKFKTKYAFRLLRDGFQSTNMISSENSANTKNKEKILTNVNCVKIIIILEY